MKDGANVDTEIFNNIIINQHAWRGCIAVEDTAEFTCDYNILNDKMSDAGDGSTISLSAWQALGFDGNSLLAGSLASLFNDPSIDDFQLIIGSQAIDSGTGWVSPVVTVDIDGNARPVGANYDIGAYEFIPPLSSADHSIDQIAIFPNPITDHFTIVYDDVQTKSKTIQLFDVNGKLMKSFNPGRLLRMPTVPPGLYILRIQLTNDDILNKKIMVY